jgi:hypothetical protein
MESHDSLTICTLRQEDEQNYQESNHAFPHPIGSFIFSGIFYSMLLDDIIRFLKQIFPREIGMNITLLKVRDKNNQEKLICLPRNYFSPPATSPSDAISRFSSPDWQQLSEDQYIYNETTCEIELKVEPHQAIRHARILNYTGYD